MNWLAAKAVAAYTAALLVGIFLNIDRIEPWYAGQVQKESSSVVLQVLQALQRVNHAWGIAQVLDQAECQLHFLYSPSYKDDSRCGDMTSAVSPRPPDRRLPSAAEAKRLRREQAQGWSRSHLPWRMVKGPAEGDMTVLPATFVASQPGPRKSVHATPPDLRMAAEEQGPVSWIISPSREKESPSSPVETKGTPKTEKEGSVTVGLSAAPASNRIPGAATQTFLPNETEKSPTPLATGTSSIPAPAQDTTLLVLGDSLALGLAPSMERALGKYEGLSFARVGKVSSGLTIPHLFNWDKNIASLIEEHKASILVVMMGVNDANNNVRVGGRKALVGTAAWPEAYQERVENFLQIIAEHQVTVYWVNLPVVRDTAMSKRIEIANGAARQACSKFSNCRFIDTHGVLTDESGKYTNFKKDNRGYNIRIRAKDGVHFSTEGGDLLSEYILQYISQYVELRPKQELDKHI